MITLDFIQKNMQDLKGWNLEGNAIVKELEFGDFKEAINFVNKVAEIAEKHAHHPDIVIRYNKVHLTLTTHTENSLSEKDFEVAKEIDKITD